MLKRGIHSGVDSENVAYSCIKGDIFWKEG